MIGADMKKIIFVLFLMICGSVFSCTYISSDDAYLQAVKEIMTKSKMENKLHCDRNNKKMLYYFEDSDYLQIGLDYKSDMSKEHFNKILEEADKDINKIYSEMIDSVNELYKAGKLEYGIDGLVFTVYVYKDGNPLMIFKEVIDGSAGKREKFINKELSGGFSGDFKTTGDVEVY